jgi:hypothetical protein
MAFYCACGFIQINLQDTTGIELLLKTIADTLCDKNAEGFAWIVPESEEHCIIPLMKLCSGSLLNTPKEVVQNNDEEPEPAKGGGSGSLPNSGKEVVEIQNDLDNASNAGDSSNVFPWCQYPPSSISDVDEVPVSALLTNMDLEEAFAGLDLLNKLLPPPLGFLVSPEKMQCSGELVAHARLNHRKSGSKVESILIHTKKVHKLRYIHPHTQWVPDPNHKRLRNINDSPGKRMKQMQAPGYWEVIFHGETQPMQSDEESVSQFKKGLLDEVKRLRCGFVDIPLGDFEELHLHSYPNLMVPEALSVYFFQLEGEDLCVSKSLASALYAIGFEGAAEAIYHYGESQLRGGTVDAIRKVGQYTETQLPQWITRKVLKNPHTFDWKLLQE